MCETIRTPAAQFHENREQIDRYRCAAQCVSERLIAQAIRDIGMLAANHQAGQTSLAAFLVLLGDHQDRLELLARDEEVLNLLAELETVLRDKGQMKMEARQRAHAQAIRQRLERDRLSRSTSVEGSPENTLEPGDETGVNPC